MKSYADSVLRKMKKDELIHMIQCSRNDIDGLRKVNDNQFGLIRKLDIELQKYRWHDLQKNPWDLPKDNNDVEVVAKIKCKWDGEYRTFKILMSYKRKIMYGKPIGWGVSYPYNFHFDTDRVIAWREIELLKW